MLVKETINYYYTNDSDVYSTLLDATKAFDRVNYRKLFDKFLKVGLSAIIMAFVYTALFACVLWNGVTSQTFPISNGVRQGGVLSPILFCVYLDGLISRLTDAKSGWFIGQAFVGVLMHADDIAPIAHTSSAMRTMLNICDSYAKEYSIIFNANKSQRLYYPSVSNYHCNDAAQLPIFTIARNCIEYVETWPHLVHTLSTDLF